MDHELDEMRQQLNVLKEKLDNQEIVNDSIIRRLMNKNVSNINIRYRVVSIICMLMIPYSYWAFVHLNGMSLGFWVATCVLMLIVFVYTGINGRYLKCNSLLNDNLVNSYRKIAKAKKLDHDWLKIGIPLIVLWLGYFCYEIYKQYGGQEMTQIIAIYVVSALVGAAIGLKVHFSTQDKYKEILDNIEDLTKEDN